MHRALRVQGVKGHQLFLDMAAVPLDQPEDMGAHIHLLCGDGTGGGPEDEALHGGRGNEQAGYVGQAARGPRRIDHIWGKDGQEGRWGTLPDMECNEQSMRNRR